MLVAAYARYMSGDAEMEKKAQDLVDALLSDPAHRKAIELLKTYTPSFRDFFDQKVLPAISKSISPLKARCEWKYPSRSTNPHEINVDIGEINERLVERKIVEKGDGVFFMLKCGDKNQGDVGRGDKFDLLLMLHAAPTESRRKVLEKLGRISLPESVGTPRQWGPWECLWAGGSVTLNDYGDTDAKRISDAFARAVESTYSSLLAWGQG